MDALIEQAVYTRVTAAGKGYELLGRSSGVTDAEACELAQFGPEDGSLLEGSNEPVSINFHRLGSGAYCISRTCLAVCGERDRRIYTQFLLVSADSLARFANNPFALLRAAASSGMLRVYDQVPANLEAAHLRGNAPVVDLELVADLTDELGPAAIATLIQTALSSDRMAVSAAVPADRLLEGLLNVLPVEDRTQFSFSTGLKISPERLVRISFLPADQACWREIAGQGITLLDLNAERTESLCWSGWAGRVAQIMADGDLSVLANELDAVSSTKRTQNVGSRQAPDESCEAVQIPNRNAKTAEDFAADFGARSVDQGRGLQRADAPHARFERIVAAVKDYVPKGSVDQLAALLAGQPPEILDLLERVDDLVFTAINGDSHSLAELEVLWPTIVDELNEDLVEQSREQYLRCALSIWGECVEGEVHKPERAVAAIDVLCVLFEE